MSLLPRKPQLPKLKPVRTAYTVNRRWQIRDITQKIARDCVTAAEELEIDLKDLLKEVKTARDYYRTTTIKQFLFDTFKQSRECNMCAYAIFFNKELLKDVLNKVFPFPRSLYLGNQELEAVLPFTEHTADPMKLRYTFLVDLVDALQQSIKESATDESVQKRADN